ncbi:Thioredoxin domain-containing protein [Desulfacinum hydrothermale DSM 13146]|uniref:Thioredoxin domain-containing protein n=1 Tax=Desulfacinum hydrothermale DSM 13146 TaxID=1121390 RepID=A0A1W1XJD6_9BACT|nr:thioredoxin family protein [Desulfacinum hydrothermale]SMC24093.1 Thioredoxin domain-containing protein [Desulfacinum hydrothermale DSM 13146]
MAKVRSLNVAGRKVGVVGLDELLEAQGKELASLPAPTARQRLLEELSRQNYIPAAARQAYADAFYRELLRHAGLPVPDEAREESSVLILGPGCAQCDASERTVMEILSAEQLQVSVDHVRDPVAIAEMGVVAVPALLVGQRVLFAGRIPPKAKLRNLLLSALRSPASSGDER